MQQYLDLLKDVLENGKDVIDRTGVGRRRVFARQMRFDLSTGEFPLVTTKKVHLKSIIHELLWFLSGDTDIRYLKENGVSIWDEWIGDPVIKYEKLSYAEIVKNIKTAINYPEDQELIKVFATDKDSKATDIVIPYDQVTTEMAAYKEIVELASSLSRLHGKTIPVCSTTLVGGDCGPIYGRMWRAWPNMQLMRVSQAKDEGYQVDEMVTYMDDDGEYYVHVNKPIDQISELVKNLKEKPFSARHIVSGWNPTLLPEEGVSHWQNVNNGKQALPPCHTVFQFFVEEMCIQQRLRYQTSFHGVEPPEVEDKLRALADARCTIEDVHTLLDDYNIPRLSLSCQLLARSQDLFLGTPFNIASYALFTMMLAQVCGYAPGEYIHTSGDTHLYADQLEQAALQLTRDPRPLPKMKINPNVKDIFSFKYEDFELIGYDPHPAIKAKVAV